MAELSAILEKHGLIEMRHYAEANGGSVNPPIRLSVTLGAD